MKKINILFLLYLFIALGSCNKNTQKEFYSNGKLKMEYEEKNGIKDGIQITYYTDGQIMSKSFYTKNSMNGEFIEYYKSGNIESYGFIKNNVPKDTFKLYYENGQLKEWRFYDNNGNIKDYTVYDNRGKIIDEKLKLSILNFKPIISITDSMDIVLRLENTIFNGTVLIIGNLDEKLNLTDTLSILKSEQNEIKYKITKINKGQNKFSGVIQGLQKIEDKVIIKSMSFIYFYEGH